MLGKKNLSLSGFLARYFNIITFTCYLCAIGFMLFLQYVNNLHPCYLCYVQRLFTIIGIAGFIIFSTLALTINNNFLSKNVGNMKIMAIFNTIIILCMFAISFYQLSIERHWIVSKLRCASLSPDSLGTIPELTSNIVRCDVPQYFMGVSVATLTLFALCAMLALCANFWCNHFFIKKLKSR